MEKNSCADHGLLMKALKQQNNWLDPQFCDCYNLLEPLNALKKPHE